jgi:hypothetical protein
LLVLGTCIQGAPQHAFGIILVFAFQEVHGVHGDCDVSCVRLQRRQSPVAYVIVIRSIRLSRRSD